MTALANCEAKDDVRSVVESRLQRMQPAEVEDVQQLWAYLAKEDNEEERSHIIRTLIEIIFPESIRHLRLPISEEDDKVVRERLDQYRKSVGERIRVCRERLGLTQFELAELTGLAQSHISRLEIGKHAPTFRTMERLAEALRCAPGDLDPGFPDEE